MQKLVFIEGDTAPKVAIQLLTGPKCDMPVDLSAVGTSAKIRLAGSGVSSAREIALQVGSSPGLGEVIYDPSVGGTEEAGSYVAEIQVHFADGTSQTVLSRLLFEVLPKL